MTVGDLGTRLHSSFTFSDILILRAIVPLTSGRERETGQIQERPYLISC